MEEVKEVSISITNLRKSYGNKKVLDGIDLEIYKGELFGLLGKNGVGKSTTIDCMIGTKKYDSGSITILGNDISDDQITFKSEIGYAASEPTCYEVMSGYDYLEFIASIFKISEGTFKSNYEYLANRLDLSEDDLRKSINTYSHGMKQKLCLIASLLHNPSIWVLDEPTVGLDVMAVEELKQMMKEYKEHGKTVIITSHNIELMASLCDRVAILNNGKVEALYDLSKDKNKRLQLPKLFLQIYQGSKK